jgi:hypothetical protein
MFSCISNTRRRFAVCKALAVPFCLLAALLVLGCPQVGGAGIGGTLKQPQAQTASYSGVDASQNIWNLLITQNTGGGKYAAQPGDSYKLVITDTNASSKTSSGTVSSFNGTVFKLKPANGTAEFEVTIGGNVLSRVNGTITYSDGTSDTVDIALIALTDPIPINTAADMGKIGLSYPLNGKYELKNNITLSNWMPIGTRAAPFTGCFYGGGNTITLNSFVSGADVHLGIFGVVEGASAQAKAELSNIQIVSSINQTSLLGAGQVIGALAAWAKNTDINNISLSGTFSFTSAKTVYLGGVAGLLTEGAVLKNCSSSMTITGDTGTGGVNTGTTLVTNHAYSYIGGFAGMLWQGGGVENCHNTASVTVDSQTASSQVFVGGVAGGCYYAGSTNYHGYIADSSSSGNITGRAKGFWTYVGGIAGTMAGDGGDMANDANTSRIVRCRASGTVSTDGTASGNPYVGGIVGYNYYGALVSQSSFSGTVIATKSGDYTGGIAGYNSQTTSHNSRIEDCWSSGAVTGFNNAGGIVGQNQINTYIRRCYSIAAVSTTNGAAAGTGTGGIAGMNASAQSDAITACFALNSSISSSNTGTKTQRVVGTTSQQTLSNNYASSGLTPTSGGGYTADEGTDKVDGADCAAQPGQGDYAAVGWNFATVWKMGGNGYPRLQWEP